MHEMLVEMQQLQLMVNIWIFVVVYYKSWLLKYDHILKQLFMLWSHSLVITETNKLAMCGVTAQLHNGGDQGTASKLRNSSKYGLTSHPSNHGNLSQWQWSLIHTTVHLTFKGITHILY